MGVNMTNHLRFYRKQRGFSQTELAKLTNLTQNTISSIECGIYLPSLSTAFSLAEALCVPITLLFDFSDEHVIYNDIIEFDLRDD